MCSYKIIGKFELEILRTHIRGKVNICEGLRMGNCNSNQSSKFVGTILI